MNFNNQPISYWIELAEKVATRIHANDTRNDGSPYIRHCWRVAMAVEDRLKPIAWLHDTVEDHPDKITIQDLRDMHFPEYIVVGVELLTHLKGVPNMEYWAKIKENLDALEVKRKDINDNVNDHPSEKARQKYALALQFFNQP